MFLDPTVLHGQPLGHIITIDLQLSQPNSCDTNGLQYILIPLFMVLQEIEFQAVIGRLHLSLQLPSPASVGDRWLLLVICLHSILCPGPHGHLGSSCPHEGGSRSAFPFSQTPPYPMDQQATGFPSSTLAFYPASLQSLADLFPAEASGLAQPRRRTMLQPH